MIQLIQNLLTEIFNKNKIIQIDNLLSFNKFFIVHLKKTYRNYQH